MAIPGPHRPRAQPAQHGCPADPAGPARDLLPRSASTAFPAEGQALLVQDRDAAPPPSPRRLGRVWLPAGFLL
ncbi:unnamed protein product [Rangifer tarandus platyrhynchus]|uniref:Uncharacterized protein n=1 Tax=Rangifer tarandus platyrhynchus TaxID=3082113 RepID=A0ABN8YHT4_RANTA|nr:unnamed protein product [Rangifer tarandus platyrhynchus]